MQALRLFQDSIAATDGTAFAAIGHANLALPPTAVPSLPPGTIRFIAWSGWFGESADARRGRFPRDFKTWTPAGWSALEAACETLAPELGDRGVQLCLRPHARHVLSDVQGTLSFLRKHPHIQIVLDPASLFTGSMVARSEDHLTRIFETLGPHPAVAAVLLANVQRIEPDDSDALEPAPLHGGLIDPRLLLELWRSHCSADLPLALLADDPVAHAALLAGP